ncbi:aspartyl-tRNA synthetase [Novymonas esmeraldas]|uniref:aspartate--tRNA ligase n=1 Tax=Novymonas esmeraldas TaxID=1808958 RepID=A0AAW0F4S1_9TRYP
MSSNHVDAEAPAASEKKISDKEARKAARLAEEKARADEKAALMATFKDIFGALPMIQSTTYESRTYVPVSRLSAPELVDTTVLIRARVSTTRKKGKMAFMVLRDGSDSVQAMAAVEGDVPKEMIDFMGQIPTESIVDVEAAVCAVEQPITSTSHSNVELKVRTIHTVTESLRTLPFTLEDASRKESDEGAKVNSDTRLNSRWLDLRTPASGSIFRLQSRVCQYFRQFLIDHDFWEIHSPKIINAPSEGGANVFKLEYFNRLAYLAQSPQLYKQMVLQGDVPRVFEVGPVFRSENSNTHRHLTEFVGLDVEMRINEHYYEVLDVAESLFNYMFEHLATNTKELKDVCEQYPFEPLVWKMTEERMQELGVGVISDGVEPTDQYAARVHNMDSRMLRINYMHCIELLNTVLEEKLAPTDDINTTNEKLLGKLVKTRYGVDFFISDRFPSSVRPFYTMECKDDSRFTNSYDMFIRGEEISSGAQRIHDPELLLARAKMLNVDLTPIKDYVDSFRLGAWPHGGFGVGMERVVMLYLGLGNVRLASLFPRDPQRTTP